MLIDETTIKSALLRLGQYADDKNVTIEMILVGGAAMALKYAARQATKDVDVVIVSPSERKEVWKWVNAVARDLILPEDWLNDSVKGFVSDLSIGDTIIEWPGIRIMVPVPQQLLAMKLCAWRDDVDIKDAQRLLAELPRDKAVVWELIRPFLIPGFELKAQYALEDLWDI